MDNQYSAEEQESLEGVFEDVSEEDWLEVIYGSNSNLTNHVWLEKVISPEGRYVFDATIMRAKIFATASVTPKHIDESKIIVPASEWSKHAFLSSRSYHNLVRVSQK